MTGPGFRFDRFLLDPSDRRLSNDGAAVDLNARYLDALTLLVNEAGRLVPKDRFLDEVWRGVPVTDEALTQCIKTLRRQLGDDAAAPRFIETVPKHGYRFIAPVERVESSEPPQQAAPRRDWREVLLLGSAGTIGGGMAGFVGGLIYGFAGASQPLAPGMGAVSVLLVLLCLTILVALMGGAGVGFGIASASFGRGGHWTVIGGAAGGFVVGAVVKLLGLDAFNLLIGRSPGDITGPFEGVLLGAAVGLGAWLTGKSTAVRRSAVLAALVGGAAGALIPLLGGHMMGGSLDVLAHQFPGSRLRLDHIGAWFGETGFGPLSQSVTAALEGALFSGCVVGAMKIARRNLGEGG